MTYEEAIEYFKSTNQLHLIEKELSVDGYTVVALAEYMKEKNLRKEGDPDMSDPITTST